MFIKPNAMAQVIADALEQGPEFGAAIVNQQPGLTERFPDDIPVDNIQYAHARICSVLRQLNERGLPWDKALGLKHLSLLDATHEVELIKLISRYPEVLEMSVNRGESEQLAYFLRELAKALHGYYNAVQLLCDKMELRCARLCLLEAVKVVLNNGLGLSGVPAPESM